MNYCKGDVHGTLDFFPHSHKHVGYRRCIHSRLRDSGSRGEPVVIFNIRDPLDRLFSAYNHGFAYGVTKRCGVAGQAGCKGFRDQKDLKFLSTAAKLDRYAQRCYFGADNMMVQLWDPVSGDPDTALENFRAAAPNLIVINADSEGSTDLGYHQLRAALCDAANSTVHSRKMNVGGYKLNSTENGSYPQKDSALSDWKMEARRMPSVQQAIAGDRLIFEEALQLLMDQDAEYARYLNSLS